MRTTNSAIILEPKDMYDNALGMGELPLDKIRTALAEAKKERKYITRLVVPKLSYLFGLKVVYTDGDT